MVKRIGIDFRKEIEMSSKYEPQKIELEIQKLWSDSKVFERASSDKTKKSFYCLEMFPYPSGKLHMGHVRNYTIGDAVARFQRMHGRHVIYPMGFDSFGLPAENAAIQGKAHPKKWTFARIDEMISQMKRMGFSYDWNRNLATCTPEYYRWNQWFFLKFMEQGLAYRKGAPVNCCPKCNTVLANEQVHDGRCWRHEDTPVEQKTLEQWFLKTTAYAERLIKNLDKLEGWPENVKEMQRHWIGRSQGSILRFPVENNSTVIETFTTRPDTVYGITYLVLAPEHPLVDKLVDEERKNGLEEFRREVYSRTSEERTDESRPKNGYALGRNFINPFTGKTHPIYVADYVLMDYGTGAVMAVPAHDQRDFEFARRHGLPIKPVIHPRDLILSVDTMTTAYVEDGIMRDSGRFDNLPNRDSSENDAWHGIVQLAKENGWGDFHIQYRLRDWLISRQRYWGTPIPVVYCDSCGIVPAKELPVILPDDVRFDVGGNPLASSEKFVNTLCPSCGKPAKRETDTMDTFVDSSWYFMRYCDNKNSNAPFDPEKVRSSMPVDQYIGGVEHACMHLIYARFFTMVLHDMGLIECEEPFTNLLTQGMVCLETYRCPKDDWILPSECSDGKCVKCGSKVTIGAIEKMSKSKKNTVDPGEIINKYGADTARTFILFASPPEKELLWSDQAVEGSYRFLRRVHDLVEEKISSRVEPPNSLDKDLLRKTHETILKVTKDISEKFQFNTAIAALMELLNSIQEHGKNTAVSIEAVEMLLRCLAPIAPHLAEHAWKRLGKNGLLAEAAWPEYDAKALIVDTVEIPVQINGKLRGTISVSPSASEAEVLSAAAKAVKQDISKPKKVIYKQGKILNLVV